MSQEPQAEKRETHSQKDAQGGETTQPVDVWGIMRYCLLMLHSCAWQYMGLVPDPATGKVNKDIDQAKIAIDAAAYLAEQLEKNSTGQELRELRSMISDLRLNYVQQKGSADAPADEP